MKRHKIDPHWGSSLRTLPWEEDEAVTASEQLISSTVKEWYDAKHRKVSADEISLTNGIAIESCPYCNSEKFIRSGHYGNGIQRYKCKECGRRFSPLTNTIFEDRKIPISEWIEYLLHLFEFHSIKTSARDNRNADTTGKYWLIKVFSVLEDIQNDVKLRGNIYIDEMFFSVIKRETVTKDNKALRGISRNKIAVAVGFDNHRHYILKVEYTSKPSDKSTWEAYGSHIVPGSHLIHDGEKSHGILIRKLNLTSEVYSTDLTRGMPDSDNPLYPINRIHYLAKRFMREHGGYNRDNLQDWMNLIWFLLSEPDNRYEKVSKFIDLAISSPKRVKYRDVMCKKDVNNQ